MSDEEPMINGTGGEGFAVDGTDSFAIEPVVPDVDVVDTPPASRRGLFLTVATGMVLLLIVVIAGSSGDDDDDEGSLRAGEVRTSETARTTTTMETDSIEPDRESTSDAESLSGDDVRTPLGVEIEAGDEATDDTTAGTDVDDFNLDGYDGQFDDFNNTYTPGRRSSLPRRVPYVPQWRRPPFRVPSWYHSPTTSSTVAATTTTTPTTTTVKATTTTVKATTTTVKATTTTATTAPPWRQVACPSGLGLWGRASGVVLSVPNGGVWTFTEVGGPFTRLNGDAGPGPHRTFAADPFDAGRGWFVDSTGVLRQLANGTVAPVAGAPADVRSLSVHVAAAGAQPTMLVAAGQPPSLERLVSGSSSWEDVPAPPSGTLRHVLLVDPVTLLVSTDEGISRRVGGDEWTLEHTGAVVGEPAIAAGTISWLADTGAAGTDGVVQSSNGGQDWLASSSALIAPNASRLAALPDGRVVTVGTGDTLVASPPAGQSTWVTYGSTLPITSANVAGVARSAGTAATFVWASACGANAVIRLPDAP